MFAIFYRIIAYIAAFFMAAMMVVTVMDASGRYFFNAPLHGAIEYISYFLAILIVAGYALITRDRGHITVGVVAEFLPRKSARVERVVTALGTLAGCGFITWFLIKQGLSYQRTNRVGESTQMPLDWLVFALTAISVFAVLFAVLLVRDSFRNRNAAAKGSAQS